MLGLIPAEFDDMTIAEFEAAEQGYLRRMTSDYRTAMNIERWGCYAIMSAVADLKGRAPHEVLPLPWDAPADKKQSKLPTKKELAKMQQEAIETAERFEQWVK